MAYAAVISLKHTFERLINPTNPQDTKSDELKKFFEDILKKLDTSSHRSNRRAINAFDAQIREAAFKLEDELESSYGLHRSLPPSDTLREEGCRQIPTIDEEIVEREICSFLETVKELEEEHIGQLNNQLPEEEDDVVSPSHYFGEYKSTMVGLSDQFEKIREELLDPTLDLKTVSLFGMAGIGKTRLAEKIYEDPSTIKPFHVRVWATLGPKHRKENLMEHIADQIERVLGDKYMKYDSIGLGEHIYKNLCGRRYFIVLDDIWSTQALDDLKVWLPKEEKCGSRLLLTTRLEEVANYATVSRIGQRLLNHEESWNLFWPKVFSDKSFPDELKEAGRKIAKNCEGLPLLILAVANILRGMEKTEEYWNRVANTRSSTFPDAYNRISEVLCSSYEYLPQSLKACFLYMGAFPQNYEIPLHKLINLWTVEDFHEPKQSQTSQDFAMECLDKLVSQSLVFVRKDSSNNRIKSCKLHSTYWHLCVILASKDKFLHVLNFLTDASIENMESNRRLSVQNNVLLGIKEVHDSMAAALRARSLLCTGQYLQYEVPVCLDLMLLKVLDVLTIRFYVFPIEALKLLQLKYLALTHNGNLPLSISKLQNLQSLILSQHRSIKYRRDSSSLPKEIWDMQELRYLRIIGSNLPDPSSGAMLPNLLTLHVDAHSCTGNVFRGIPKLKKLGIKIELRPRSNEILNCFDHISILSELESLKCVVVNPRLRSQVVAPPNPHSSFPSGLKKLSLNGIGYFWEDMSAIGSLSNLQVLKLRRHAFRGPVWETKVEFPKLEFLLLEDLDLEQWTVDGECCFPILERLIIRYCYKLKEIPSEIGDITTLKTIEVVDCMPSVRDCARNIEEDVLAYSGSDSLQVPISLSWEL